MRNENISIRLKKIMLEKNLKQSDIIKKCKPICDKYNKKYNTNIKITKSDLSQWISGIYEPRQNKLTILAEALETNEVWLMGFDVSSTFINREKTNIDEKEIDDTFREILKSKGFLNKNEEITEDELNHLIDFAKANKRFIMNDKK